MAWSSQAGATPPHSHSRKLSNGTLLQHIHASYQSLHEFSLQSTVGSKHNAIKSRSQQLALLTLLSSAQH